MNAGLVTKAGQLAKRRRNVREQMSRDGKSNLKETMHVTFGLSLDSRLGPSRTNALNQPVLGRLGFLGLLETYLGLARPQVSTTKRVTNYLGHLRLHETEPRFYSRSLEADSVGTAALLLSWRDEWRLGGWDGKASDGAPQRVRELALVESTAVLNLPLGEAERLWAVIGACKTSRIPVKSVTVIDPVASFPRVWQHLLEILPNVSGWEAMAQGEGHLRVLQERAGAVLKNNKLRVLDEPIVDGSVLFVRASNREAAENWLGAHCRQFPADRVVLCESDGDSLDATLMATGGASSGFQNSSALRPALQALGLALELCWAPVDVGRLVEFLAHPVGPFSRAARARLGRAVAEQPGIGGAAWTKAKAGLHGDDGELLKEVAFWLEGERWPRAQGAPVEVLIERVTRLTAALRARFTGVAELRSALGPALDQCGAVLEGLEEFRSQGVARLTPRQIEQLIVHGTPAGLPNPHALAQIGCLRAESDAGACFETFDEVVWWMPATPRLPASLPWSQAELDALEALNVQLRDPKRQLEALSMQWLRPLCAAKKRFVMVLPPPGEEEHPMRQMLLMLAPDLEKSALDLDAKLGTDFVGTLSCELERRELLAAPERINLGKPLAVPREKQSFSSLTELFHAPALYAIKRVAKLSTSTVLEADDGNRLLGTLAHRVVEKLFLHPDALTWTEAAVIAWFDSSIDALLGAEGATLLMEGAGINQARFKNICRNAICSLLASLKAAGAVRVRTEVSLEGFLGDVGLVGQADLLVDLPGGRYILLDMKWRGAKRHGATLADGKFLQLALYSLQNQQKLGGAPVALGYFIFETADLLLSAPDVVPGARVFEPPEGATTQLLEQAKATWRWRAEEWARGELAVVPVGGGEDFDGPEGTLPVAGPNRWDMETLVLLGGWEQ